MYRRSMLVLAAGTLAVLAMVATAQAETMGDELPAFSLARGQKAQLNVTYPPSSQPPEPCIWELSFVDKNGDMFVDEAGDEVSKIVTLDPGQTKKLRLSDTVAFLGDGAGRVLVRPMVMDLSGREPCTMHETGAAPPARL